MKWAHYYLTRGDGAFEALWEERSETPTLVIVGGGFDPRTPRVLSSMMRHGKSPMDIVRLELSDDSADDTTAEFATRTQMEVEEIAREGGRLINHPHPGASNPRSVGLATSRTFHEAQYLSNHREVVVDVSGLPRAIYFPLVKSLLQLSESGQWRGDIHVTACDNPAVDASILGEGAEAPSPLGGFAGNSQTVGASVIWVPILGEGRLEQVESIWSEISPAEVIPVLPFPSSDPRRADNLLIEHMGFLFDVIQVEPRNFMHADETNPFDLYRSLARLYERYQEVLAGLGGVRFVLSTHSSKLLSIGALLAAFEFEMQVQHVSSTRSGISYGTDYDRMRSGGILTDLWLKGAPYS